MGALWHPFADMAAVTASGPLVIERGEGCHVWDTDGNRYLDAIASLWYCNVGYGRTEIADAVAGQLAQLHAYHTFGDLGNLPAIELADRIAALAPVPNSKVFFTSGGSDSVDSAAKLARRYWHRVGEPGRTIIITRERAYHGMHAYGTALAGIEANKADYGDLVPHVATVPWDSATALADAIDEAGPDQVAAFFCEPIVGAGGVLFPPAGYLKEAERLCRERGVLFIADEVITGFGRAGEWFASARFGLEPDIIIFAKGVTSGYAPLGGIVVAPRVAAPFWDADDAVMWRHGYTYSGHAAACAAGIANLDIMARENLPKRALAMEADLVEILSPLAAHDLVTEIRTGPGFLAAVQFDPEVVAADPSLGARATAAARKAGVLTRYITGGAYQVSPPLVIDRAGLEELASGFDEAIARL